MSGPAGVRPRIWALVLACLLGVGAIALLGRGPATPDPPAGAPGPDGAAGAATAPAPARPGAQGPGAGGGAAAADAVPGAGRRGASADARLGSARAGSDAGAPRGGPTAPGGIESDTRRGAADPGAARSDRVGRVVRAGDGDGGGKGGSFRAPGGAVGGGAVAGVDPTLEREVAQLGEKLGLVEPPGDDSADPADPGAGLSSAGDPAEDEARAAADAVAIEFLLREELQDRFGGKILPFAYPIEGLREDIAQDVSDLSAADRQVLLEYLSENLTGDLAPLVMSDRYSGNVYYGPDAEPNPQNVLIHEARALYKRD